MHYPKGRRPDSVQARVYSILGYGDRERRSGSLVRLGGGFDGEEPESKMPNKAPEPTTRSVTPRAFSREPELKFRTDNRHAARVAPERVVAHL